MKIKLSATHAIILSFFTVILLGALLLSLPISSSNGEWTPFIDAVFTSTTATCVTGLVVVPTFTYWSFFGQAVILVLIQTGGLGVITVVAGFLLTLKKKLRLSDSVIIQDSFNINTLSGLSAFVKKVLCGTAVIELVGALCYMTVFVKEFGGIGVWYSVFNSVSAFCNAGIDIVKANSLIDYAGNLTINLTTSLLIILGGIGYVVWFDVISVIKNRKSVKFLTLHSKIALVTTAVLIFAGGAAFFVLEYSNSATIGSFSLIDKITASVFQSVTTRTAGFATLDQASLTDASALVSIILMFIGGSPVGTAGGVKTVTLAVIAAAALSSIRNREDTVMFSRTVPLAIVKKAIAIVAMSFCTVFFSSVVLLAVSDFPLIDILYEAVSATATVGLSRNLTFLFGTVEKAVIIITMFFGRVGPISLAFLFKLKEKTSSVKFPSEKISVG